MNSDENKRAVFLRDMAVKLARNGSSELVVHRTSETHQTLYHAVVFRRGELKIYYRTLFQKLPPISDGGQRIAASLQVAEPKRGYGIEVYYPEKVFGAEWDETGGIEVTTFIVGPWEAELEALVK